MRTWWAQLAALAVIFTLFVGCDSSKGPAEENEEETSTQGTNGTTANKANGEAKDWDPSLGTAAVEGTITFEGKAPRRRPISMGGDAQCASMHEGEEVLDESAIIGADGGLANVFIWIKSGLEEWRFKTPEEPVTLDQKGCRYTPHVLGMQVGQELLVRNSDPLLHNVHSLAELNPSFNWSQPNAGAENRTTMEVPEVMFKIKCDVHGWMSTYIGVVPHPYFTITNEDGYFQLGDLPPGTYTVEAVHERFGRHEMEVTVAEGETKEVNFSFSR